MEPARTLSYGEYLAFEEQSPTKHEFVAGQIVAMAGGTLEHARLASALTYQLMRALDGSSCRVLSSDARVRIETTESARYPDLSIVCGDPVCAGDDADGITNPVVLVEVLSKSTEGIDRGEKFAHYKRLDSLREYVLVSQSTARVEVFRRTPDGWLHTEAGPEGTLPLRSLPRPMEIDVGALYRDRIE